MGTGPRLYVKITRDTLPRVKDKYPFLYLEHGRLAIDDSSVKWIDSDGNVVRIPIATICSLFLGPGTTVTHEAIKVLSAANCSVCWMGEDSLLFYAFGDSPTSDTKNFRFQMKAAANPTTRLSVAKRMFQDRFPGEDLTNRNLSDLRGMEGRRVKALYLESHILPGGMERSVFCSKSLSTIQYNESDSYRMQCSSIWGYSICHTCIGILPSYWFCAYRFTITICLRHIRPL